MKHIDRLVGLDDILKKSIKIEELKQSAPETKKRFSFSSIFNKGLEKKIVTKVKEKDNSSITNFKKLFKHIYNIDFNDEFDNPVEKYKEIISHLIKTIEMKKLKNTDMKTEARNCLENIFDYQEISDDDAKNYIMNDNNIEYMDLLYFSNHKLSQENISLAIDVEKNPFYLYKYQNLDNKNLTLAIKKGLELKVIYEKQKLNNYNQKIAIEKGEHLELMYKEQDISEDNIKLAIQNKSKIISLYKHNKISDSNLQIAITNSSLYELESLYNSNNLTSKGKEKLYLFLSNQSLDKTTHLNELSKPRNPQ